MSTEQIAISDAKLQSATLEQGSVRIRLTLWDGKSASLIFTDPISSAVTHLFGVELSHLAVIDDAQRVQAACALVDEDPRDFRCYGIFAAMDDAEALVRVVARSCELRQGG
jgi:hypothetical protein